MKSKALIRPGGAGRRSSIANVTMRRPHHAALIAFCFAALSSAVVAATVQGRVTIADSNPVRGVAGVMISDGHAVTRTRADGYYTIPRAKGARFITIVNPPGFQPGMRFHRRLPEDSNEPAAADFALTPSALPLDAPFRFIQTTDNHGTSPEERQQVIDSVNALPEEVAFMIDSGDLSMDTGSPLLFAQTYGRLLRKPYFPVIGNHDLSPGEPFSGHRFEAAYGPRSCAWFFGRYLFVGLPWSLREGSLDAELHWLEQLLTQNRENERAHVVLYFHHWDGLGGSGSETQRRFVRLFRDFNIRAVLVGHWHASQVYQAYGIPTYMSRAPRRGGNRDLADGSYRLITASADGSLRSEFRTLGHDRSLHLVTAEADGMLSRRPQPVVVNAYDTTFPARDIAVSIQATDSHRLLQEMKLPENGGESRVGEIRPAADWPAKISVRVKVIDERGEAWPSLERNYNMGDQVPEGIRPGSDWPMWQHDGSRTGMSPDTRIEPPLSLAWAHATGAAFGFNSPIVIGGRVYIARENNHEALAPMPAILALDAGSGKVRWSHSLAGKSVRSTLAGNREAIAVLADDGTVLALDPQSGRPLWQQTDLVAPEPWQEMYTASPALQEGVLVAGMGPALAAYELASGRMLWKRSLVPQGGRRVTVPSPTLAGDRVIVHWDHTQALFLESGNTDWQFDHLRANASTPVVAAGRVVAHFSTRSSSTQHGMIALALNNGQQQWTMSAPLSTAGQRLLFNRLYSSPVVAGDRIYTFDEKKLYAVDASSGKVAWDLAIPGTGRNQLVTGSAAVSGHYLFAALNKGMLIAVDTNSRKVAWTYSLGTRIDSSLAISGNALYVAGRDGTLYAFVGSARALRP